MSSNAIKKFSIRPYSLATHIRSRRRTSSVYSAWCSFPIKTGQGLDQAHLLAELKEAAKSSPTTSSN